MRLVDVDGITSYQGVLQFQFIFYQVLSFSGYSPLISGYGVVYHGRPKAQAKHGTLSWKVHFT